MIGILDTFREHLDDLGDGLGVTDPVSGEAVLTLPASKPAKKKAAKPAKKGAKKAKAKKRR